MSGLSDLELWTRINAYQLDKADISLSFSARLARENGWSEDFARRVCDEYKKFIYLVCVSRETMTPSQEVDEAGHLHLVYTKSYWQDFCRDTLGRELHHTPTEGGEAEGEKFREAYERTLKRYHAEFGEAPPADIWPSVERRFDPANRRRMQPADHYLVRKKAVRWAVAGLGTVIAGSIASVLGAGLMMSAFVGVMAFMALAPGGSLGVEVNVGGDGGSGCGGGCGGCG